MYLPPFEHVASTAGVKDITAFNPPGKAVGVEVQADTQAVRYTMDGVTDPTSGSGMLFLTTSDPKYFQMDEFKKIRFIQSAGGAGALNVHYYSGRNI